MHILSTHNPWKLPETVDAEDHKAAVTFGNLADIGKARCMPAPVNPWCALTEPVASAIMPRVMPKWRNGRRDGLKNRWGQLHVGSTPTFGTKHLILSGRGSAW